MSKKEARKNGESKNSRGLRSHTKHGILAIVFFVLAIFFLMSAFHVAGVAGILAYEKLSYLLGVGYILLPILLLLLGYSFLKSETPEVGWIKMVSGLLFLLSGLGTIDILSKNHAGG